MGNKFGIFGAVIILFFCLVGLLAPLIAPHQPMRTVNWLSCGYPPWIFRWARRQWDVIY
jgi:hypothetical protein